MTLTTTGTLDVHPRDAAAVEQVEEWFRVYHDTHNAAIRERIILAHMGLADRLAGRFRGSRGASYEDLVQSARVGLVSAVNLVPLRDLLTMSASQVVGNLLVFAALGFFAPLRFAALASVPRIVALAAGCSVLVETAQYVLPMDRVSSVDDVLLNAAGAGLAALASRRWWRTTAQAPSDQPRPALAPGG